MYNSNNCTFKTGINDLGEVLKDLKKSNFPEDQWDFLGLELGIIEPKLTRINADYPRDAKRCLKGCLSLWLQCNYDTSKYGKPTMESLAAALREIDLNGVASEIMGEPL